MFVELLEPEGERDERGQSTGSLTGSDVANASSSTGFAANFLQLWRIATVQRGMNTAQNPSARAVPTEGEDPAASGVFPVVARSVDDDIPSCERPTVPVPRGVIGSVVDLDVYSMMARGLTPL
jgi:hypothetical protein